MSKDYIKGFNEGCLIAVHMPHLARLLADATGETPRLEGLRDGCMHVFHEQMEELESVRREQSRHEINVRLDRLRGVDHNRSLGGGKDTEL